MPAKKVTLGALLLLVAGCFNCNCMWFETTEQLQRLFEESDVVFVGRPIRNVAPGRFSKYKRLVGTKVLLKVISRQKGLVRADTVLVLQKSSNCNQVFTRGTAVIVFGNQIQAIEHQPSADSLSQPGLAEASRVFYVPRADPGYDTYRRLLALYPGLSTSQCITFRLDEAVPAAFIRSKRR